MNRVMTEEAPSPEAVEALLIEKVRAAGSSFYWGMRMLDRKRRLGMFAVYAFCREIDDIADGDAGVADPVLALDEWRRAIEAVYAGFPTGVLCRALAAAVTDYGLEKADLLAVIDGCAMDTGAGMVRPSLAELDLYCDRVACAVGRLSVKVFGEPGAAGSEVADHLGRALQLTNILRDVAEDAAIGRLYLPDELLAKHGITSRVPAEVAVHPALPSVCRELGEEARHRFQAAERAMARCAPRTMRPARMMAAMYLGIFQRLEAAGWKVGDRKICVPTHLKIWYLLRHAVF